MKEQKRNKEITGDPVGDPAFYNDQIGDNKEPMKKNMEKKKGKQCKKGV